MQKFPPALTGLSMPLPGPVTDNSPWEGMGPAQEFFDNALSKASEFACIVHTTRLASLTVQAWKEWMSTQIMTVLCQASLK